jgi:hypothetical protein
MRGVEQKHRLCRQPLWWLRHCFSAFKVSAKNGLFLGQMTWVKLDSLEAQLRPVEHLDLVQENSIGKLR